ncbi:hypothetical protein BU23DRAFT_70948 [Bimuria novae-zelandiae CBS 107.79]|uniref:Uncharacterized protein n=1 Tax=Bimuria novae-zelandiae CBS 107.79 TaxID=1447943 RepID=A0A6A5UGB7_9PLEO|nr:hypothetical protein BU23DRAFT_70948 [Bimuria novae-zelandiae CBS 107.79]
MAADMLKGFVPFQWYIGLEKLPVGFPEYRTNTEGEYIIPTGEIFCRAPFEKGNTELCGKKFVERGPVMTHLKHFHAHTKVAKIQTGRSSATKLLEARAYYKDLYDRFHGRDHDSNMIDTCSTPHQPEPSGTATSQGSTQLKKLKTQPLKPLLQVPRYQISNAKKQQKKGEVNYNQCRRMLVKGGYQVPCEICRANGKGMCSVKENCANRLYFQF